MVTATQTESDASLSHHGIKGMRWGVRRFQNKDGSLKNAGKKRYDEGSRNPVERHRQKLINKYVQKGYSNSAAQTMAKQKNKVLDKIAVGNGYKDKFELLRDYNIIPTVKMPKHKKMEFVSLLLKHLKKRKNLKEP